jgi:hypothetical protein
MPIWEILEGLAMKDVDKFYILLVYFTAISLILWQFGVFCGHFVVILQIFPILVCCTKKKLATLVFSLYRNRKHLLYF